jgi:hypothetical protein
MAITDYDAPRRPVVELEDDSLEELTARRAATQSPTVDLDEPDGDFERGPAVIVGLAVAGEFAGVAAQQVVQLVPAGHMLAEQAGVGQLA